MPDRPERYYWDANVPLSYINGYPERLPIIASLLHQASMPRPDIEIVTSTLSIAEVAFSEQERINREATAEEAEKIARLWNPSTSPIRLVEVSRWITEEAVRLIRSLALPDGWRLTPRDAIHLASARYLQVAEFQTYDDKLDKFSDALGFPILRPHTDEPMLAPLPDQPPGDAPSPQALP